MIKAIAKTIEVVVSQTGTGDPIKYVIPDHEANKAKVQNAKADI